LKGCLKVHLGLAGTDKTKYQMENWQESLTDEDKELIRIESESFNAVKNGIDWGKAEGDLEVEVILYAMKYLQQNPGASIPDAIDHGLGEWLK